MDEFDNDRDSNASSEEQLQQEHDDAMAMEDADDMEEDQDDAFNEDDDDNDDDNQDGDGDGDGDGDNDQDNDGDHDDHDGENEHEQDQDHDQEHDQDQDHDHDRENDRASGDDITTTRVDAPRKPTPSSASALQSPLFRPRVRPEALTARLYDIVPTMAAPQATSINTIAITPDLRYWMTGGTDGYVRKYDGPGTINGKQLLTVAQRHPFVDSVVKAGILMSYWENFEPITDRGRGVPSDEDKVLSPVYSLAVHREALWSLAGLESGGINIHSVRYDEGKVIHTIPAAAPDHEGHTNAVSVLQLTPAEQNVLSGSWDKRILDWDLNTGSIAAKFDGSGGQISAIELRPLSGAPIPPEAAEEPAWGDTFRSSTRTNGFFSNGADGGAVNGAAPAPAPDDVADGDAGSDHESLFGSPGGSLFGEGQMGGGGNAFGGDDDNEFSHAMLETLEDAPGETLGDTTMTDAPAAPDSAPGPSQADVPSTQPQPDLKPLPDAPPLPPNAPNDASQPPQSSQADVSQTQGPPPTSPTLVFNPPPGPAADPTQTSHTTFFAASMDGVIRLWDRRQATPLARIGTRPGVPPWCMGACWSPSGDMIYAGRRNGTVEEFSIHKARGGYPGWQPERSLKFPAGSGAVSAVRGMANGRHLVCASHDILRLYDLHAGAGQGHNMKAAGSGTAAPVPFLIIPGPPRAGVISQLYVDPTSRFMLTAAGTRGWDGSCTEVLIGYEISCVNG